MNEYKTNYARKRSFPTESGRPFSVDGWKGKKDQSWCCKTHLTEKEVSGIDSFKTGLHPWVGRSFPISDNQRRRVGRRMSCCAAEDKMEEKHGIIWNYDVAVDIEECLESLWSSLMQLMLFPIGIMLNND